MLQYFFSVELARFPMFLSVELERYMRGETLLQISVFVFSGPDAKRSRGIAMPSD